jgi:hypothetical protein
MPEALDILAPWIGQPFGALDAAGGSACDPDPLAAVIETLISPRERIAAVPRCRPLLALWHVLREIVEDLARFASNGISVCEAADPTTTMNLQAVGQARMDQAAATIGCLAIRLDRWASSRQCSFLTGSSRQPELQTS